MDKKELTAWGRLTMPIFSWEEEKLNFTVNEDK